MILTHFAIIINFLYSESNSSNPENNQNQDNLGDTGSSENT